MTIGTFSHSLDLICCLLISWLCLVVAIPAWPSSLSLSNTSLASPDWAVTVPGTPELWNDDLAGITGDVGPVADDDDCKSKPIDTTEEEEDIENILVFSSAEDIL